MFENTVGIHEIFSMQNIILYFIIINLIGFLAMWLDKKRAIKKKWRISEPSLFLIAIIGGSIGAIIGMYTFRHKTKKKIFTIGMPIVLILQIIMYIIYF